MSKSEKAQELIRLIEELIDVKVSDAIDASKPKSSYDSMAGFGSYGKIEKIKKDLLKTLVTR